MLASFLMSGTDSVAINKLFASQSTSVNEILDRPDVATYLRQLSDMAKVPKNVLAFVERNMPTLLLAAQQKTVTSGKGSLVSSSAEPADSVQGSSGEAVNATQDDTGATRSICLDSDAAGKSAARPQNAYSASATACARGKRDSKGGISMEAEDTDDDEVFAAAEQQLSELTLRSANATSLLFVYLSSSDCSSQAIAQIVPVSLAALAHPGVLNPAVSLCVQRLLLAAFDNDFIKTTEAIAITLDEDIVHGTIDNLSQSSIVAETLIALFGSALSASFMMAPATKTELFTSAWIHYRFVDFFCAEMTVAIANRVRYNYFYFFREVLKRGFSHTAGPVADVLLRDEFFSPILETVITACEDDARLPVPSKASDNSSLSPEAMAIMSLIVSLLRKSLIVPETSEMYGTTTDYIAPLRAVRQHKERLVRLLGNKSTSGAAIVAANTLGLTRLSVCELFVELSLYDLSSTDTIVVESGFLPAFLQLCDAYADHDSLARLLHRCVLEAFTRPVVLGTTLLEARNRDIFVKYIVDAEDAFSSGAANTSPTAAGALFSSLFYFASSERMRYTPMATFSIDVMTMLDTKPFFSKERDGPLSHLLDKFRDHAGVQERVRAMQDAITGDKFEAKGSAKTPSVKHRAIVNLAGDRMRSKLSPYSGFDKEPDDSNARDVAVAPLPPSAFEAKLHGPTDEHDPDVVRDGGVRDSFSRPPGKNNEKSHTAGNSGAHESVKATMDSIAEEVSKLRATGSPQLKAYPDFRDMQLSFGSRSALDGGEEEEDAPRVDEAEDVLLAETPSAAVGEPYQSHPTPPACPGAAPGGETMSPANSTAAVEKKSPSRSEVEDEPTLEGVVTSVR